MRRTARRNAWLLLGVLAAAALPATALAAGGLAVNRGLPAANLNDTAGADRSNVAWNNGADYVTGDTFKIGSSGETWYVSKVRTWNIGHTATPFGDEFSTDTLYFGTGAIAPIATGTIATGTSIDSNPNIRHKMVTYAGGANYQAQGGMYRQLWQNDFKHLGLLVDGGKTYYFAVDGTSGSYLWFNHASNASLSGSPEEGANDQYNAWAKGDLTTRYNCDSNGPFAGVCDGGWDKSSDINVKVFATQVATAKNLCKNGGWDDLVRGDGTDFKNQGDCIQYVNAGK